MEKVTLLVTGYYIDITFQIMYRNSIFLNNSTSKYLKVK